MLMHKAMLSRRRGFLSFSLGICLTVLSASFAFPLDYTIKEVIEVGEADFVPYLRPVIWSPDGTKIAFTKGGVIKISDTLGNVQDIIKLDMPIHKWDWISDSQIAVYMRTFTGQGANTIDRLSIIDVKLKKETQLHNYMVFDGYREVAGYSIYMGPFKSVEGNHYYVQTTFNSSRGMKIQDPLAFNQEKSVDISQDHFLRWSDSGLYMVRLDGADSAWLAKKPFQQMSLAPVINSDLTFVIDHSQLFNLKDSSRISLGFHFGPLPPNTVECGAVWSSFNNVGTELLLTISCDDGHNYVNHRIATFDCSTLELKIIDPLIGKSECAAAAFSPNGKKIAFMANEKVHILTRQFK